MSEQQRIGVSEFELCKLILSNQYTIMRMVKVLGYGSSTRVQEALDIIVKQSDDSFNEWKNKNLSKEMIKHLEENNGDIQNG